MSEAEKLRAILIKCREVADSGASDIRDLPWDEIDAALAAVRPEPLITMFMGLALNDLSAGDVLLAFEYMRAVGIDMKPPIAASGDLKRQEAIASYFLAMAYNRACLERAA